MHDIFRFFFFPINTFTKHSILKNIHFKQEFENASFTYSLLLISIGFTKTYSHVKIIFALLHVVLYFAPTGIKVSSSC